MAFILDADIQRRDASAIGIAFDRYYTHLESIRDRLPARSYDFAAASWHYDPRDHRCPHDAWVETMTVKEVSSDDRARQRALRIDLCLLGAYHDGRLNLFYETVKSYCLDTPSDFKTAPFNAGHGDWLTDEIRLSDQGFVVHEIEFSRGSHWMIECADIAVEWNPVS